MSIWISSKTLLSPPLLTFSRRFRALEIIVLLNIIQCASFRFRHIDSRNNCHENNNPGAEPEHAVHANGG